MKAKPYKYDGKKFLPCSAEEASHVSLNFPGPSGWMMLPVILRGQRSGTNCWSWNGDTEKPTLKPSILSTNHVMRCHTWVNDGRAQFLADCSHELAGQTLDMLEVEETD